MKRKLGANDEAETAIARPEKAQVENPTDKEVSFAELGLDARLVQAVALQHFEKPTPVQCQAIPLALNGNDIMAKAPCGSGKTAAYVLPVVSSILSRKGSARADADHFTSALILAPTRELSVQITRDVEKFTAFCAKEVSVANLTDKQPEAARSILATSPDIVISTPATACIYVDSGSLSLEKLSYLVLDEADLVVSYGYAEDLEALSRSFPKAAQILMMSATLTDDLDTLKGMFSRQPTLLDLQEPEAHADRLTQFVVRCGEDDKFLLLYVIFKLQLLKGGKFLIFVADIDRCYRLKMFLEHFGIKACTLNSELPVNSRIHVVEEFNRGVYDIIIASDEHDAMFSEEQTGDKARVQAQEAGDRQTEKGTKASKGEKKRKPRMQDREYGVSRGIDFKNVAAVINFDLPTSASSYSHRIGRTARAGKSGMALSFVIPKELYRKHVPTTVATTENDEKVLRNIVKKQAAQGREVKPYHFDMEQVEAFRYRMNDALRAVTRVAVREARTRELRKELLNSEKLKRYFEENPDQLKHLARHDSESRTSRQLPHLRHVPDYLLPREGKKALTTDDVGFVPLRKEGGKVRGNKKGRAQTKGGFKPSGIRKRDPLKRLATRRKK